VKRGGSGEPGVTVTATSQNLKVNWKKEPADLSKIYPSL
jgi:hypothetical protein